MRDVRIAVLGHVVQYIGAESTVTVEGVALQSRHGGIKGVHMSLCCTRALSNVPTIIEHAVEGIAHSIANHIISSV